MVRTDVPRGHTTHRDFVLPPLRLCKKDDSLPVPAVRSDYTCITLFLGHAALALSKQYFLLFCFVLWWYFVVL